jgi:hypothetical protein
MSLPISCHNEQFGTLGQIDASHLAEIANQGYKSVINNRPDGENTYFDVVLNSDEYNRNRNEEEQKDCEDKDREDHMDIGAGTSNQEDCSSSTIEAGPKAKVLPIKIRLMNRGEGVGSQTTIGMGRRTTRSMDPYICRPA